jgi:hypothetical protein
MMGNDKIQGTDEAWESGELGQDEQYVKVADDINVNLLDDSLELQMISIRLQKSLIEDFKMIAQLHGIGYQPLIRQALKRFADGEKNCILRKMAAQLEQDNRDEAIEHVEEERKAG